jgi:hypothetical protein
MTRTTKARTILRQLRAGPATSTELAAATGIARHFVCATLSNMRRSRYVWRSDYVRNGGRRGPRFMWQISGLGLRKTGGVA